MTVTPFSYLTIFIPAQVTQDLEIPAQEITVGFVARNQILKGSLENKEYLVIFTLAYTRNLIYSLSDKFCHSKAKQLYVDVAQKDSYLLVDWWEVHVERASNIQVQVDRITEWEAEELILDSFNHYDRSESLAVYKVVGELLPDFKPLLKDSHNLQDNYYHERGSDYDKTS